MVDDALRDLIDDLFEGAEITWNGGYTNTIRPQKFPAGKKQGKGMWISVTTAVCDSPKINILKIDITGTKLQKMLDESFPRY